MRPAGSGAATGAFDVSPKVRPVTALATCPRPPVHGTV
jgi:hypothetical protein